MQANIEPVSIFPDTATILKISRARIIEFGESGSAQVEWQLLGSDEAILKTGTYEMTPEEYNLWGDVDEYVLDIVITRLGLTPFVL